MAEGEWTICGAKPFAPGAIFIDVQKREHYENYTILDDSRVVVDCFIRACEDADPE